MHIDAFVMNNIKVVAR